MSDSEDSDVAHGRRSRKDHPPHGNRLSNGEMCAKCGEIHWHCGTLEEVAIETSLSCIRHLAPMRAFHMEVADLYLQLLKDGWMDEGDDGADWAELGTDLVIKWIANLVQDGTMEHFSSKAIVKVFGKDVSDYTRMAAKRAARVHLAAVTVVSDYLSELLPSLWRKKLNLKGLSLLKRRVVVAQAVHKHCQNVVWDGSRGTLIGTVGPLCRKVLNFDMDEVDRLMVKIKVRGQISVSSYVSNGSDGDVTVARCSVASSICSVDLGGGCGDMLLWPAPIGPLSRLTGTITMCTLRRSAKEPVELNSRVCGHRPNASTDSLSQPLKLNSLVMGLDTEMDLRSAPVGQDV